MFVFNDSVSHFRYKNIKKTDTYQVVPWINVFLSFLDVRIAYDWSENVKYGVYYDTITNRREALRASLLFVMIS